MHSTASFTVCLVSIIASVAADTTINLPSGGGTFAPPPKSQVLSEVRAWASSQVTQSAFAAELTKVPQAQGHNIPSDVASVVNNVLYLHDTTDFPEWLKAAPTNGPIASAVGNDLDGALAFEINSATRVTGAAAQSAEAQASKDDATTTTDKSTETTTSDASTITKTSGTTTQTTASTTTRSTSSSTGGAASQSTGAIMAGAVAAGVLGIAVML